MSRTDDGVKTLVQKGHMRLSPLIGGPLYTVPQVIATIPPLALLAVSALPSCTQISVSDSSRVDILETSSQPYSKPALAGAKLLYGCCQVRNVAGWQCGSSFTSMTTNLIRCTFTQCVSVSSYHQAYRIPDSRVSARCYLRRSSLPRKIPRNAPVLDADRPYTNIRVSDIGHEQGRGDALTAGPGRNLIDKRRYGESDSSQLRSLDKV